MFNSETYLCIGARLCESMWDCESMCAMLGMHECVPVHARVCLQMHLGVCVCAFESSEWV